MIQKIFCVHDRAAGAYLNPFFMASRGLALRAFSELVEDEKHAFGKHPGDYVLYEIGTWNDQEADIVLEDEPEHLGSGVEFLSIKE